MAEVRWTLQATDDLASIADFIAADSPHYASLFVMDVLASVEGRVVSGAAVTVLCVEGGESDVYGVADEVSPACGV